MLRLQANYWKRLSLCLATLGVVLAGSAVTRKSVTVDEAQALPSGLAILATGDFHYPEGTPPLSLILPAIPVFLTGARVPMIPGRNANWALAQAFAAEHASDFHFDFYLARLVSLVVLLITLLLTYLLAFRLYGELGATLAVSLAALNPTLLAHGALVTPDIYLAASMMAFLLLLDHYNERRSTAVASAMGFALGVSCLMKFTGLLLFPLLPVLLWGNCRNRGTVARHAIIIGVVALFTIHAGYAFSGIFPLAGTLSLHLAIPSWLPIPLPAEYIRALDAQLTETPYLAYLLGGLNDKGFFFYYLVAFLVKSPPALLVLSAWAIWAKPKINPREKPLIFCFIFFFLFFSAARYKNLGVRYLLFLYPWLAVWTGRLAPMIAQKGKSGLRFVAGLSLVCLAAEASVIWPDYIAYFNIVSGGPSFGYHYLLDSNLDWGQDLTTLKDFMSEKGIEVVSLAHFGRVDPGLYGINFSTLNGLPASRYVAISANFLWGRTYFLNGTLFYPSTTASYAPYRKVVPMAVLGHSIYVYDTDTIPQLKGLIKKN